MRMYIEPKGRDDYSRMEAKMTTYRRTRKHAT